MENIGSEVGQKMRSAVKAKLTELGCYVDDELPDYVMVMVANKRTRSQMEEDLQLFLSSNTHSFVSWLHQVLQKLQEVTVTTNVEQKKTSDSMLKRKSSGDSLIPTKREKKEKREEKTKSKGKAKKSKKTSKKREKFKKTSKHSKSRDKSIVTESIRPNVPPLLMNLEKESSPSITDVFAGQILKTQAIKMGQTLVSEVNKPSGRRALVRNRFPIIDPATMMQMPEATKADDTFDIPSLSDVEKTAIILKLPRDEQIKEMNAIEEKIQGLKKKLAEQFESGSEDEDFLNIRTEAEELMGDFNEENVNTVSKESQAESEKINEPPENIEETPDPVVLVETSKAERQPVRPPTPDQPQLPSIELNLPKRPLRDRLGMKDRINSVILSTGSTVQRSVNMVNPLNMGRESNDEGRSEASRIRSGNEELSSRRSSIKSRLALREEQPSEFPKSNKDSGSTKRLCSRISIPPEWSPPANSVAVGSVVRVPPRPRNNPAIGGGAGSLLMRAVADAHKSLVDNPAKVEPHFVKKALVLPMRRNISRQNIVIEVSREKVHTPARSYNTHSQDSNSELEIDIDTESMADLDSDSDHHKKLYSDEYIPVPVGLSSKSESARYVPTHIDGERSKEDLIEDSTLIARILNRRKDSPPSQGCKMPQFVVTLDGLDPNVFLNKKLENEENNVSDEPPILRNSRNNHLKSREKSPTSHINIIRIIHDRDKELNVDIKLNANDQLKNGNDSLIESSNIQTQNKEEKPHKEIVEQTSEKDVTSTSDSKISPRKRKASPIIFDVVDKSKNDTPMKNRERTSSGDDALTVTIGSTKYEELPTTPDVLKPSQLPPLPVSPICRLFPMCKFGSACLFTHPACKFAATCVRRDCVYSHSPATAVSSILASCSAVPVVASRVVPVSNYKSISTSSLPNVCRFFPNCVNPSCHYFHPKACRFGRNCINKIECNFYHHDATSPGTPPASALKWKSPFKV